MEYVELGSAPWSEDCVQVSDEVDYLPAMREECRKYKKMLESRFPIPENISAEFVIKSYRHDFGKYMEVCVTGNSGFCYFVEENLPELWEDIEVLNYVKEM